MLVNPGDNVLLDAPTYSGTLAAVSLFLYCILHTHTLELLLLSASAAPASWLQLNKRPQRSVRHDPLSPEKGPVSLESIRSPQARQHRSQGPLHHPKWREPHRRLHDGGEEEGRV